MKIEQNINKLEKIAEGSLSYDVENYNFLAYVRARYGLIFHMNLWVDKARGNLTDSESACATRRHAHRAEAKPTERHVKIGQGKLQFAWELWQGLDDKGAAARMIANLRKGNPQL